MTVHFLVKGLFLLMACVSRMTEWRSNKVLESAEFIAGHCECITIDEEAIDKSAIWLAGQHESGAFSLKRWRAENPLHHQDQSDDCLQWVFLVDSLNFCFWSAEPSGELFTVAHGGKLYTGYWSLCAAINRALEEGVPLLDAGFLRDISLDRKSVV